jgi:hypothetical protein
VPKSIGGGIEAFRGHSEYGNQRSDMFMKPLERGSRHSSLPGYMIGDWNSGPRTFEVTSVCLVLACRKAFSLECMYHISEGRSDL